MPPIEPKNLSAQFAHKARGNPPSVLPGSAISNCFPGLEFDFRNVWKNLFVGIELHEAGATLPVGATLQPGHWVLDVTPGSPAAVAGVAPLDRLAEVDGRTLLIPVTRPGAAVSRPTAAEFGNGLAHVVGRAGQAVPCVFVKANGQQIPVSLTVRPFFDGAAVAAALAEPGALTQSLCSPWQADYRECGCYYWAASRPDFVNAGTDAAGNTTGHDWMQKARTPADAYRSDGGGFSPTHVTYDDLYREWEKHLKFVREGKDAE